MKSHSGIRITSMEINTMIHASRFKREKQLTCIPSVYVQGRLFFVKYEWSIAFLLDINIYVINNIRYKRFLFISLRDVEVNRRR